MAQTDEVADSDEATRDAFPPNLSVITIVIDGEGEPHVDLGYVSPHAAISIFKSAAETLEDMINPPRITYKNRVIFDLGLGYGVEEIVFEDDDDDDDDWDDEDE